MTASKRGLVQGDDFGPCKIKRHFMTASRERIEFDWKAHRKHNSGDNYSFDYLQKMAGDMIVTSQTGAECRRGIC
jgi:hypothetical protein